MDARVGCLTVHALCWMRPWRVCSRTGRARKMARAAKALSPLQALPPGLHFAARLGLDLGIPADALFAGRRLI